MVGVELVVIDIYQISDGVNPLKLYQFRKNNRKTEIRHQITGWTKRDSDLCGKLTLLHERVSICRG